MITVFDAAMLPLIFRKDVALIVNDATLRRDEFPRTLKHLIKHIKTYYPLFSGKTSKIKN